MPASTNLIADIGTVLSNGPTANTLAKAIAAAGPIMDYAGNCEVVQTKFKNAGQLIQQILNATDAGDGQLANITAVQHALEGLSAPSGTVITTMTTVINAGPSAATIAKAIAAAGPIQDYVGNCVGLRQMLQESSVLVGKIVTDTDAGDGSLTTLNNIATCLS